MIKRRLLTALLALVATMAAFAGTASASYAADDPGNSTAAIGGPKGPGDGDWV